MRIVLVYRDLKSKYTACDSPLVTSTRWGKNENKPLAASPWAASEMAAVIASRREAVEAMLKSR